MKGTMGSLSEQVTEDTLAAIEERVELKVATPSFVSRAALYSFLIDVLLDTPRLMITFPYVRTLHDDHVSSQLEWMTKMG